MVFYVNDGKGNTITETELMMVFNRELDDYMIECTSKVDVIGYSNKFAMLLMKDGKLAQEFMKDVDSVSKLSGFIDEHKKNDSRKERARLAEALRDMFLGLCDKYELSFIED